MNDQDKTARLSGVYSAQKPEELASLYNDWAENYDADMSKVGYRHPAIALAMLARHVEKGAAPLLDAGAGTGLIGEWLAILGYPEAEALDISEGMLKVAERKRIYTALHRAPLGGELPFPSDRFAAIISTGVFTAGHVGSEGLDDLVRICRPGGVIVLTIKDLMWASSFGAHVASFEEKGMLKLIDDTGPYISMPGEAGTEPSRCVAMKVR
ncbi:methyltransferase family protein [Hoeflea marina]|uniref:Methyltransferase family protein n=1 Tax=Hoeflea marina TaxID=274592 RepID=A0A317PRB9_9HYPH|nr:class I SAM-dependent methyltransferase [Hoeflea marina]PWW02110.1 methyltransferase family protein [Hoeflea marina]